MGKKFIDLCIKDSFMFPAVVTDVEICRPLLEVILGIKISRIKVIGEHEFAYRSDYKKVRLDVYAADEDNTHFNIEMQVQPKDNLPKRMRYYSSQMDMEVLKTGEVYNNLPDTYVIFICDFPISEPSLYRYTFRNRCEETEELLEDGTCKIFLSTKGENPGEVPRELLELLKYVESPSDEKAEECESALVHSIHNKVKEIKQSRSEANRYMLFEELLEDERVAAKSEGKLEGTILGRNEMRDVIFKLISAMTEDGRTDEILRLKEKDFLNEMCVKYHIDIEDQQ